MDFLTLVQTLHYEARQPGTAPDAVTGQTGRSADLVRWVIEAWNDVQRDSDGRWKWLRSDWSVDTVAATASYVYGDCTDVDADAAITRFRAWDLDDEEPPLIYLVSDGDAAAEREMLIADWPEFRRIYWRATHTAAIPTVISVSYGDKLYLGPTPDDIYRIRGNYWKSNQTLVENVDEPEMPADYHFLIVYRALVKYAYDVVAQEVLGRAESEGAAIYDELVKNQWYGRYRMSLPDALA